MSEVRQRQESILLLDLGTCSTKVVLLDLVEEQYRAVATAQAPSTVYEPWQDISLGAVAAISRLEQICGRTLLGGRESPGPERRSGVLLRGLRTVTVPLRPWPARNLPGRSSGPYGLPRTSSRRSLIPPRAAAGGAAHSGSGIAGVRLHSRHHPTSGEPP